MVGNSAVVVPVEPAVPVAAVHTGVAGAGMSAAVHRSRILYSYRE